MRINLQRKLVAVDASTDTCVICGNDFELGSVYATATGDHREEMGPMCPVCLDYLNRRKEDAEDPTLDNWPARGWPTTEVLEKLRQRYPEPMFETYDDLLAACTDRATEDRIYEASMPWKMDWEEADAAL